MRSTDDLTGRLQRRELVEHSIDLILASQSDTGAYPASPSYPTYQYSWIRDGAFIAHAMDLHGHHDSAAAFHQWVVDTILRHQHKVEHLIEDTPDIDVPVDDRYALHTRYTLDGEEVAEDWGSFQLDGYGLWLTSLTRHLATADEDPSPFRDAVETIIRYLSRTWQMPCFDCWEEYPTRRHSTTWAAIAGGLNNIAPAYQHSKAASTSQLITNRLHRSSRRNVLRKFVDDHQPTPTDPNDHRQAKAIAGHERPSKLPPPNGVDASILLTLGQYGPFPNNHPVIPATIRAIENELMINGGIHRYPQDEFYGGGQWPVLAGAYAALPQIPAQHRQQAIAWIENQADNTGNLPEQVPANLLNPEYHQPWLHRWGPVANPLLWSHAMYLTAVQTIN